MRLLKTAGSSAAGWIPQLVDARGEEYAVLSHRWLLNANDEVLFGDIKIIDDGGRVNPRDLNSSTRLTKYYYNPAHSRRKVHEIPGYDKLRNAARYAASEGHDFLWADTICIDKSSSAELSEAINSMFQWYKNSSICYAFLADVEDCATKDLADLDSEFCRSEWWQRGWCLQELVAPLDVVFLTKHWQVIGEKKALAHTITAISGIGTDVLTHARILDQVSIARRMSWASERLTTRTEDLAYCLMGIFDVNMPLLYGEGPKAFIRLQEEILRNSDDESIFAWVDESAPDDEPRGLLATSPALFKKSREITYYQDFEDREPYVMSNRGLSISLRLSPFGDGKFSAALHCPVAHSGDGFLAIFLIQIADSHQQFARIKASKLGSLQQRGKLQAIFVRQNHETHRLDRILPYHLFQLRSFNVDQNAETYKLVNVEYAPSSQSKPEGMSLPAAAHSAIAQSWLRHFPGAYPVVRMAGKPTAAFYFRASTRNSGPHVELEPAAADLVVLLGSFTMTDVGFDAFELDCALKLDQLEHSFSPVRGGRWKELRNFHVKVDFTPHISGATQFFVTDITVSKISFASPMTLIRDAYTHHVQPFVPSLPEPAPAPTEAEPGKSGSRWKRLLHGR
jgi:hypothetical protein